jgi:hypothetical protein
MFRRGFPPCYDACMAETPPKSPLDGLSADARRVMERLLRMPPEPQKDAPKPRNPRAEAQRRRRERERQPISEVSRDA